MQELVDKGLLHVWREVPFQPQVTLAGTGVSVVARVAESAVSVTDGACIDISIRVFPKMQLEEILWIRVEPIRKLQTRRLLFSSWAAFETRNDFQNLNYRAA